MSYSSIYNSKTACQTHVDKIHTILLRGPFDNDILTDSIFRLDYNILNMRTHSLFTNSKEEGGEDEGATIDLTAE